MVDVDEVRRETDALTDAQKGGQDAYECLLISVGWTISRYDSVYKCTAHLVSHSGNMRENV